MISSVKRFMVPLGIVFGLTSGQQLTAQVQTPSIAPSSLESFATVLRSDQASLEPVEIEIKLHFNDISNAQLLVLSKCSELERLVFRPPPARLDEKQPLTDLATLVKHLQKLKKLKGLCVGLERPRFSGDRVLRDADLVELAKLTGLEELDLTRHPLRGEGLVHLEALPNLRRLILDETALGEEALTGLLKWSGKLEYLSIHATPLSVVCAEQLRFGILGLLLGDFDGVNRVREFFRRIWLEQFYGDESRLYLKKNARVWIRYLLARTKLESLDLSSSDVTDKDLELLGDSKTLKGLNLNGTGITDAGLRNLSEVANLRDVSLENTKVTPLGLKHLARLSELEVLRLSDRQIAPGLDCLGEAKSLRELNISQVLPGEPRYLMAIANCNTLEKLAISTQSDNDIDLGFLQGLKDLKHLHLNLYDSGIEGRCLDELPHPEKLLTLRFASSKLRDDQLQPLLKMTELRSLTLVNRHLSGSCLPHLKSLQKLESLELIRPAYSLCAVATKEEMASLVNLKELRTLRLSGVQARSDDFEFLAKLPKLKRLDLDGVEIDDRAIPHLIAIKQLHDLTVEGHQFSGDGRKKLQKAFTRESRVPGGKSYGFSDGR